MLAAAGIRCHYGTAAVLQCSLCPGLCFCEIRLHCQARKFAELLNHSSICRPIIKAAAPGPHERCELHLMCGCAQSLGMLAEKNQCVGVFHAHKGASEMPRSRRGRAGFHDFALGFRAPPGIQRPCGMPGRFGRFVHHPRRACGHCSFAPSCLKWPGWLNQVDRKRFLGCAVSMAVAIPLSTRGGSRSHPLLEGQMPAKYRWK